MPDTHQIEVIGDFPAPDAGAPRPIIWSNEDHLTVTYVVPDGRNVVIRFERCILFKFGAPNDETLHGHPLYAHGLQHYSVHSVLNSPWVAEIEKINSVHRMHDRSRFLKGLRHYIFTFHDSTLECLVKIDNENAMTVSVFDTRPEALAHFGVNQTAPRYS